MYIVEIPSQSAVLKIATTQTQNNNGTFFAQLDGKFIRFHFDEGFIFHL